MKILPIIGKSASFGRAFSTKEREQADQLCKDALKALDCDKVIAIVPETSLPSEAGKNIGVGQLNSEYSSKFFDFMKTYTGANSIKVLPAGEFVIPKNNFYCNYLSSGITLGTHNINLEKLTEPSMGNILSKETLQTVYQKGEYSASSNLAEFENVTGRETAFDKALFEAYGNFKKSTSLDNEKQKFEAFKKENQDTISRRALFEVLQEEHKTNKFREWPETDRNLFNPDLVKEEARNKRITELNEKYNEKIDFTFFKQYLADKNLAEGREELHKKGMSLTGDCQIGFSTDEIWAYPKAFEDASICSKDWGLRSLNYDEIAQDGSESNKLLKLKVKNYAKHYDNIRFDVGWAYVNPILFPKGENKTHFDEKYLYDATVDGYRVKTPLGDKVLKIIEDTVQSVQGSNYKKENLFYEIEAGVKEFSAYDWDRNQVIEPLKNRTIIQSTFYMSDDFANIKHLEERIKIPRNNYIIMAGNHDHLALSSLANKKDANGIVSAGGEDIAQVYEKQIKPLAQDLRLKESDIRKTPEEFVKAKFAYNFLGKNVKMFFMDIFGRSEQFDSQSNNNSKNYRYRISSNYEQDFHKAVQEGSALNIMDALSKAMKAKQLDKSNKKLYKQLIKYRDILNEKGALTEAEANMTAGRVSLKGGNKKAFAEGAFALLLMGVGGSFLYTKKSKADNDITINK